MLITVLLMNHETGSIPDNLNRNDVNVFDRWLMFPHNELLDNIKFLFLAVALVLPIISPLARNIRNTGNWLTYGIMYTQAFLFTFGIRAMLKTQFTGIDHICILRASLLPVISTEASLQEQPL